MNLSKAYNLIHTQVTLALADLINNVDIEPVDDAYLRLWNINKDTIMSMLEGIENNPRDLAKVITILILISILENKSYNKNM